MRALPWSAWTSFALMLLACGGDPATTPDATVPDAGAGDAGSVDAGSVDAASPVPDAAVSPWRAEESIPERIQEIAVEAHEGAIWVAGGFNGLGQVVSTVRKYDPSTRTWTLGPELPAPRHHMSLVSHGGDLYALAGMQTTAFAPLDTAWVLRAGSSAWEAIASLPRDRGAAAAASVGSVIIMAGGNESSGGLAAATMIYDPGTDAWRIGADIPTLREHLAGVAVGGELYVLAGRLNSLGSTLSSLEIYDPAADSWRVGPELPYPRGGFDAALLDGGIYVVGGEEPSQVLSTVDRFDIATGAWSAAPETMTPHHGHGIAALDGRIYVVAGADSPAFGAIDAVESYAP